MKYVSNRRKNIFRHFIHYPSQQTKGEVKSSTDLSLLRETYSFLVLKTKLSWVSKYTLVYEVYSDFQSEWTQEEWNFQSEGGKTCIFRVHTSSTLSKETEKEISLERTWGKLFWPWWLHDWTYVLNKLHTKSWRILTPIRL